MTEMKPRNFSPTNISDDELLAVIEAVEKFVHEDDEFISKHNPVRHGLLKLMKEATARGLD